MEYRYEEPLYLFRNVNDGTVNQLTLNQDMEVSIDKKNSIKINDNNITYAVMSGLVLDATEATKVYLQGAQ
jgi:hypothetical protein